MLSVPTTRCFISTRTWSCLDGLMKQADLLRTSRGSIVLSPHNLTPRGFGRPLDDRGILLAGTFNSGLLVVDASDEAFRFLDWWAMLNRTECVADKTCGYFSRD